jgi:small-conductance mechanosensitive channel
MSTQYILGPQYWSNKKYNPTNKSTKSNISPNEINKNIKDFKNLQRNLTQLNTEIFELKKSEKEFLNLKKEQDRLETMLKYCTTQLKPRLNSITGQMKKYEQKFQQKNKLRTLQSKYDMTKSKMKLLKSRF